MKSGIVWTPLPLLSWLFPFIGHVGIATSDGMIHDFSGPYTIHVCAFVFFAAGELFGGGGGGVGLTFALSLSLSLPTSKPHTTTSHLLQTHTNYSATNGGLDLEG